jgi:gamma-glutamylcyclotransferase (GGCT)/AIG2-like uncharacterized protein YtfP
MSSDASAKLFSYGTLRLRDVQLATFGRELKGREDTLPGFSLSMIAISDPDVVATSGEASHPILKHTGDPSDEIAGTVFSVTEAELAAADEYEVADYKRIAVRLKSGIEAFVYVDAKG